MIHNKILKKKNDNINQFKLNNINLDNIKSNYFLKIIFDNVQKYTALSIIKYNKKLQNRLNLNVKDYKEYSEILTPIEIEIIQIKNMNGQFINILKKEDESFFHIYFDNKNGEEKRNYINKNDNISKIKILIDYQIKSLEYLFSHCKCIQ